MSNTFCMILLIFVLMDNVSVLNANQGSIDLNARLKECIEEHNVDEDMADRFMSPFFVTGDQDEKCFIKCIGIKLGYLHPQNGSIIGLNRLPKDMVQGATDGKCLQQKGDDSCDTAYLQFICITGISDPSALMDYEDGFY